MEKLKIAIVGLGGIFKAAHAAAWNRVPDAEVVAVCDINPNKFAQAKALLVGAPEPFTDYKEMISKVKPDIVDICTPNYLHSEIAVFALNAGCNVICEKPDAVSVEAVLAMADAQKKSGKHLMVIRNNRWLGSSKELKARIAAGEFGEIYCGRCGWIRSRGIPGKGGWFTTKAQSGGGPLIDLGVHMIDLAIYMMGNPKAVAASGSIFRKFAENDDHANSVHSAFGEAKADGIFDVEDLAMGFVKFENGACLQIEFSWASNIAGEKNFVELRGTKKGACWDRGSYAVYDGTKPKKLKIALDRGRQYKNNGNGHIKNIAHFVDVVRGKADPDFTIDQGINMIKILSAIYESAATGKEVAIQ